MWQHVRQCILGIVFIGVISTVVLGVFQTASPAIAEIRQLEEAPGQVVYQSRHTLHDQYNSSWQAIAFKRVRPDGSAVSYLRLVGFPNSVVIDRTQPLMLRDSLGKILKAEDASQQVFADVTAPEVNVGQYDLAPIVSDLQSVIPLQLCLPTLKSDPVELVVSPTIVQEWQALFIPDDN